MNFIKKHKASLVFAFIVIALLVISFFLPSDNNTPEYEKAIDTKDVNILDETSKKEVVITQENTKTTKSETKTPIKEKSALNEEEKPQNKEFCTLVVRCDSVLNNIDKLKSEKLSIIPKDGIILNQTKIELLDSQTAFDVLKNELKKHGIHLEFNQLSMYDSVYIEGIGNLYEFDAGDLSGWIYRVNGKVPSVGCSQYKIENGDQIEFLYTCNMGRDL